MGTQAKLKKLRKSSRATNGTAVVTSDHNTHLFPGIAMLDCSDDYTNHNCLIADEYLKDGAPDSNIILVIDRNTGHLAEIMPNERGSIPWEEYEESQQLKQVRSKDIAVGGLRLKPSDPISYSEVLSMLSEFMPMKSSNQVLSTIRTGISNGRKWIILKDEQQNIRCCLHPDDIRYWNSRCV